MQTQIKDHAALAEAFIEDEDRVNWHDGALWWIRQKRDIAAKQIPEWEALRDRLAAAGTRFEIAPHIRFVGQPGEHATMFLFDPAGNALEFKAFRNIAQLFAK